MPESYERIEECGTSVSVCQFVCVCMHVCLSSVSQSAYVRRNKQIRQIEKM